MYDASSRHKPRMYMNGVAESNVPLIDAPQMVMTSRQQAIKVMAQNVEHLVVSSLTIYKQVRYYMFTFVNVL